MSSDSKQETTKDPFPYLSGFGNEFESEYIQGALPKHRNTPRNVPYNLYTEQLSGTAFTTPRTQNRRTWVYRIQPSVAGRTYEETSLASKDYSYFGGCHPKDCVPTIEPIRWNPPPEGASDDNGENTDFVTGMKLMCSGGDLTAKQGIHIYMYAGVTSSMESKHLCNTDGDFCIVPQQGSLNVITELGRLHLNPCEICVLPRGMIFQVQVDESGESCRGYVLEISTAGTGFQLPELGPIGSNGLANPRDFQVPSAWCTSKIDYEGNHVILTKMGHQLIPSSLNHSPYNVVAWHGNYVPYKYNLQHFCAVNSVSYDHLDPSIYTVLTCPSGLTDGVALADVVVFPPRIMATDENTFRPPWFHKNCMSEYMGLIYGQYDAKEGGKKGGFVPGGASLHNCMTPHGPDAASYEKAVADPCTNPTKLDKGMAFMFETFLPLKVAPHALASGDWRDKNYNECWQGLKAEQFTGWDLVQQSNKENT